jgi:hypothetical protein
MNNKSKSAIILYKQIIINKLYKKEFENLLEKFFS